MIEHKPVPDGEKLVKPKSIMAISKTTDDEEGKMTGSKVNNVQGARHGSNKRFRSRQGTSPVSRSRQMITSKGHDIVPKRFTSRGHVTIPKRFKSIGHHTVPASDSPLDRELVQ